MKHQDKHEKEVNIRLREAFDEPETGTSFVDPNPIKADNNVKGPTDLEQTKAVVSDAKKALNSLVEFLRRLGRYDSDEVSKIAKAVDAYIDSRSN